MKDSFTVPSPSKELVQRAFEVRQAASTLSLTSDSQRQMALNSIATSLESNSTKIVAANAEDISRSTKEGLSESLLSRLQLSEKKLKLAIEGVKKVSLLPDPIGSRQLHRKLAEGLLLERLTVPLGVLGVIFEARPDALIQIASLAIRSGNSAILKGGAEAKLTNQVVAKAIQSGLDHVDFDSSSICLLTTREESLALLHLDEIVDLIIPRGSNELVKFIKDNTRIPVLGHADGICHLYVDNEVNLLQAISIAIDSKCQYPAACNAIETLLLHKDIAASFLEKAIPLFDDNGVTLLGDELSNRFGVKKLADESDWKTEYLDLVLSIKVVNSIEDAMDHIRRFGSRHTDAIATTNMDHANRFLASVDSAGVYHNCSTRFADGFRYGFGAEVGISTQTLPPRGPVGLEGLVTYKYFLRGDGHLAGDFALGKRSYLHNDLDL